MNKFEAVGLAVSAAMGSKVVVIVPRLDGLRFALDAVATEASRLYPDESHVQWSQGHEAVKINGGEVVFTFRKSGRVDHYEADAVFLRDAWTATQEVHDKAAQMVAARGGEVILR